MHGQELLAMIQETILLFIESNNSGGFSFWLWLRLGWPTLANSEVDLPVVCGTKSNLGENSSQDRRETGLALQ